MANINSDISIITLNSLVKWQRFNKMPSVGDTLKSQKYMSKMDGRKYIHHVL